MSFESDAMYNNNNKLKALVDASLEADIALIFEYTRTENQIVIL